jgi:hypothetical protein
MRRLGLGMAASLVLAGSAGAQTYRGVVRGFCPFPLSVSIVRTARTAGAFQYVGPTTITLRNTGSGRSAVLRASGGYRVETATGDLAYHGHMIWLGVSSHVPYLSTDGSGGEKAPGFVISGPRPKVIDPCALVAGAAPSTAMRTTHAPWPLPAYPLSQIERAGLTPVLGNLIRHDHAHVDVIVDGRRVTVPAGVGMAGLAGGGPCPTGAPANGDCATGHFYVPEVGFSPIHTHSASGIVHIEADRPGAFTLGQFFDEWGVRLDRRCLGGYCSGGGQALRVYVNGRRVGNPRAVVLRDREEIAVLYGRAGDFTYVPSRYTGGWPGVGCGGSGERSCLATLR